MTLIKYMKTRVRKKNKTSRGPSKFLNSILFSFKITLNSSNDDLYMPHCKENGENENRNTFDF